MQILKRAVREPIVPDQRKMIMTRKKLNPRYVIGLKYIYLSKTSSVHIESTCWRLESVENHHNTCFFMI